MAQDAALSFIEALRGQNMTYTFGPLHVEGMTTSGMIPKSFTSEIDGSNGALAMVRWFFANLTMMNGTMGSHFAASQTTLRQDPRPQVQNLIIGITDGYISVDPVLQDLKASGTRILAISTNGPGNYTSAHVRAAGPKVDTGSVWTSDIITVSADTFSTVLPKIANQLKSCTPGDGNGGGGSGSGENGDGSGAGGSGSGSGQSGSGSGQRGTGSGGGGTSATRQGDESNPIPTPTPQGIKKQDPPKQEPSPFFDGKLYGIGSDPDAQSPADLVRNPNKILKNIWFYVITGTLLLGGGVGAGYWFWWRGRKQG